MLFAKVINFLKFEVCWDHIMPQGSKNECLAITKYTDGFKIFRFFTQKNNV